MPKVHLGSTAPGSPRPPRSTYHIYVAARAGGLHFEFTTGIVASYWTESDVKFAEGRADAAVRTARGFLANGGDDRGSDAEPMVACRYCKDQPAIPRALHVLWREDHVVTTTFDHVLRSGRSVTSPP